MISIKEIAQIAGVSRGTVDRALNNRSGVNSAVAERIRGIAAEYGYKSNRAALALAARKKPLKIGAIFPLDGNVFFEDVVGGLRAAESELADSGVTVEVRKTRGFSEESQLKQIDELVESGMQALVFAAVNEKSVVDKVNELTAVGIPVITANTDLEKSKRLCYVGTDYIKSGRIAAGMIGLISDKHPLKVVIFTGSIHVLGHNQRITGFNSAIRKYHPNIRILDVFETLDDAGTAYELTMRTLKRYPDLDAIYLAAGGIGGTCRALIDAGKGGKIKVFAHDITTESRPFLEQGVISATICQDPFRQGYLPVKLLFDYSLDKREPEQDKIFTANDILIRENL